MRACSKLGAAFAQRDEHRGSLLVIAGRPMEPSPHNPSLLPRGLHLSVTQRKTADDPSPTANETLVRMWHAKTRVRAKNRVRCPVGQGLASFAPEPALPLVPRT